MFSGAELEACLEMASYCALNDYEARMLSEKTGRSLEDLANDVDALVVTRGAEGSQIYVEGQRIDIPCVKADALVDPTGCGDAFRSGLLYGIANGMNWETTGRLASVMGSLKIAQRGGQNHRPSRNEIAERYAAAFGEKPW